MAIEPVQCTWMDLLMKTASSGPDSGPDSTYAVGIFTQCVTLTSNENLNAYGATQMESVASSPDPQGAPANGNSPNFEADFSSRPGRLAGALRDELDELLEEVANDASSCPYLCQLTVPNLMTASFPPAAYMTTNGARGCQDKASAGMPCSGAGAWPRSLEQGAGPGEAPLLAAATSSMVAKGGVVPGTALRCSAKESQSLWIARSLRRLRAIVRGRVSGHPRPSHIVSGTAPHVRANDESPERCQLGVLRQRAAEPQDEANDGDHWEA